VRRDIEGLRTDYTMSVEVFTGVVWCEGTVRLVPDYPDPSM